MDVKALDWEQTLFTVILHAGNARSCAKEAAELAAEGDFEGAEAKLAAADDEQVKAHKLQARIIKMEARGEQVPFSMLLVHAMDLLLLAWAEIDSSEHFLQLYRRIEALSSEASE